MNSRDVPSASPSDSTKAVVGRLVVDDASNSILNGKRSPLMSREQNGGVGPVSSPVGSGRREILIRSLDQNILAMMTSTWKMVRWKRTEIKLYAGLQRCKIKLSNLEMLPLLKMPIFWLVVTSSGFLGLAISFIARWFLHQTGATTYGLVGSLNKIPLSVTGILLFKVPTSLENFLSILFGLLAGVFFAKAKMRERSQS